MCRPSVLLLAVMALCACTDRTAEGRPARRALTLLHLADLHSHLVQASFRAAPGEAAALGVDPGDPVVGGGVARLATLVAAERERGGDVLVLDGGDALEGTSMAWAFGGEPEQRVLEELGVDAQVLGNHDLSVGAARLAAVRARWVSFPLLGANVGDAVASGLSVPSIRVERGGVAVGVVGAARSPDGSPPLGETARDVQAAVDALRGDVDVVVLLSHLGLTADEQLVPLLTGVDLVLGAHTHVVTAPPRLVNACGPALAASRGCHPAPVPVVHSGAYGRYLGVVSVVVSTDREELSALGLRGPSGVVELSARAVPVTPEVPEAPTMAALVAPYVAALARAGLADPVALAPEGVSRAAPGGGDSALGNLVTAAMRRSTGAALAFLNTTGVRADLPAGLVAIDDVMRAFPFDDEQVGFELPGAELEGVLSEVRGAACAPGGRSPLQLDGGTLVVDCREGGRATLSISGVPARTAGRYRVATTAYLTGAGRWFESRGRAGVQPAGKVRDALLGAIAGMAPCEGEGAALPCLSASTGAAVDGRIDVRR